MRIRKTPPVQERADSQEGSISRSNDPIDLRPYRRIGCLGPEGSIASFVVAASTACRNHGQVFALEGVLDGLIDAQDATGLSVVNGPAMISSLLRDKTTSVLIFAKKTDESLVGEITQALSRETATNSPSELTTGPDERPVATRVVFIDTADNVEALLVLNGEGAGQIFVRPEFNREDPPGGPAEPAVAGHTPPVLFDRAVHDRPVGVGTQEPPVGIAILGPVGMTGTNYPLERHPKLTELVVYLTLHPEGATSRNWTTALWPERRVPAQTIANRLSEARRIVGFASDERPRLRRNGERHCLVEFNSDWDDFQRLGASDSPEHWRQALELVRGRPFDGLAQGQWVIFEGFLAEVERSIASVALMLGDIALEADNAELCTWAAQQALKACPFDERLHRMLMRAADALGSRAGVESTLRQLALILEIDGDPLHGVHPKTAQLYQELTAARFSRA